MERPKNMPKENTNATKHDKNKTVWSALPWKAAQQLANVMTFGVKKYGKFNYLSGDGLEYSRLWDAAIRHLTAWNSRKDCDIETGLSHLAHAMACCAMLLECQLRGVGKDDRK